jgi:hypothetical protein
MMLALDVCRKPVRCIFGVRGPKLVITVLNAVPILRASASIIIHFNVAHCVHVHCGALYYQHVLICRSRLIPFWLELSGPTSGLAAHVQALVTFVDFLP